MLTADSECARSVTIVLLLGMEDMFFGNKNVLFFMCSIHWKRVHDSKLYCVSSRGMPIQHLNLPVTATTPLHLKFIPN